MSRTPINSPAEIKAAVDALLAESGFRAPLPAAQFRRVVSVRRLRQRLGGGDHATLSRSLRELEQQYHAGAHARRTLPALPEDVGALMERVWATAVAAADADVLSVREEAARSVATANAAREDADVRVDLLRRELADLSATLEARNQTIGQLQAQLSANQGELTVASRRIDDYASRLSAVEEERAAERHRFEVETARLRNEYEGLRVSLLTSTDAQRQEAIQQRAESDRHLKRTEQLLKEVMRDRDRLLAALNASPAPESPAAM
jgi:septal ring factor EnvC (AmiA/AmiB activator)